MERKAVILPLIGGIIFPNTPLKLKVGPEAQASVREAQQHNYLGLAFAVAPQGKFGNLKPENLPQVGVLVNIQDVVEQGSSMELALYGLARIRLTEVRVTKDYWVGEFDFYDLNHDIDEATEKSLIQSLVQISNEILEILDLPPSSMNILKNFNQAEPLMYLILHQIPISLDQKQELLEIPNIKDLALRLLDILARQRESIRLQKEMSRLISEQAGKAHRENILREQLKNIQEQLNEGKGKKDYRQRVEEAGLPDPVKIEALSEVDRLETMGMNNPEATVIANWLDLVLELPWQDQKTSEIDLDEARRILEEDHYGLEKVKKRIIEFLAVLKLKTEKKGALLLLVGPPGVGKTSLGKSIARALEREFVRASLGGVRDEADIRGHRRTYIGALPGRILRSLRRAKSRNVVFLLDEIDKLSRSWNGDPAAALLEVLDPEQNNKFVDHFLDLPFDLSQVFFIATANTTETIPPPLLDRMEMIVIPGYTEREKSEIAARHLWPRALTEHGLSNNELVLEEKLIDTLITKYTREAGVRELQRKLATLVRVSAQRVLEARQTQNLPVVLKTEQLRTMLGNEAIHHEEAEAELPPGVAVGLAWTPVGGEILYIETAALPGSGKVVLTGHLGDVMKESAQLALSLVRLLIPFAAEDPNHRHKNWHIHVPAGASPKDGPSAGVAILTALASLVSARRVDPKLAMTGEITLRGAVLPVGGIKEKVLAAHRAGIKRLILPKRNQPDWDELPEDVKSAFQVVFVERVGQVLKEALGLDTPDWPSHGGFPEGTSHHGGLSP